MFILPEYNSDNWYIATSEYPHISSHPTQETALASAVYLGHVPEQYLKYYALALNNGWTLTETHQPQTLAHAQLIETLTQITKTLSPV